MEWIYIGYELYLVYVALLLYVDRKALALGNQTVYLGRLNLINVQDFKAKYPV